MDKNTTNRNFNIHDQKTVARSLEQGRVVSPVHPDKSGYGFLIGNNFKKNV